MNDNTRRMFFYGMGAVYLIYLAYNILTSTELAEIDPVMRYLAAGFFIALALIIVVVIIIIRKK